MALNRFRDVRRSASARGWPALAGALLVALLLFLPGAAARAEAPLTIPPAVAEMLRPDAADLAVKPVLVFDIDSGEVLLARAAGQPWYPASLTKLMTAYLVFEAVDSGRLRLDQPVTVSRNAVNGGGRGAARYGAKPGERLTVDAMLAFLLVRSDADMAVALAEAVAGTEREFVRRMNATARRLGLSGTRFANVHGMHDPRQVTTARDIGLLAMAIYRHFLRRHPDWWRYFSAPYLVKGKSRRRNRNHLLAMMPGANGLKTGFLCTSGFNLAASARRGRRLLGAVVLGRRTGHTRALFARVMLEEGFRRQLQPNRRRGPFIAALRNTGGEPVNMRRAICLRQYLRIANPQTVTGWAVAYGAFTRAVDAQEVLAAEMTAAGLPEAPADSGVARLPETGAWAGLVWNLADRDALRLCALARLHRTPCRVYATNAFAAIAPDLQAQYRKHVARLIARANKRKMRRKRRNFRARQKRSRRAAKKRHRRAATANGG